MRCRDPFIWRLLVGRDVPWSVIDARRDASDRPPEHRLSPNGRLIVVSRPGTTRRTARDLAEAGLVAECRVVLQYDETSGALSSVVVLEPRQRALARLATAVQTRLRRADVAIVCRRREAAPSEPALSELLRRHGLGRAAGNMAIHRGSGGTFRVMTDAAVVRFPSVDAAVPRCEANYRALERLARGSWPFATPRPLGVGMNGDLPYFVESRVPGAALDYERLSARTIGHAAETAVPALVAFQRATLRRALFRGDHLQSLLERPAARLAASLDVRTRAALEWYVDRMRLLIGDRIVPLVLTHGDFKIGNVLWSGSDRVTGIVDWDLSIPLASPVVDYAFYLAFDRAVLRHLPFAECLAALVGDPAAGPRGIGPYQNHCRALGIDDMLFDAGVIMALIHFGNNHPGLLDDQARRGWCDRHLSPYLTAACLKALARLSADAWPDSTTA